MTAGGRGSRVGAKINKALLLLAGRPVTSWALEPFHTHPRVDQVVLVLHVRDREILGTAQLGGWSPPADVLVVDGGSSRQESVLNGLRASGASDDDLVLVHDGARPLVSPREIGDVIEAAELGCGALVAIPVPETLKRIDRGERVIETPPRDRHRIARTPQAFRAADLDRALENALTHRLEVPDCASCVEALRSCPRCGAPRRTMEDAQGFAVGCSRWPDCPERTPHAPDDAPSMRRRFDAPIRIVEGRIENIKITYPQDLEQAEFLLARPREEG